MRIYQSSITASILNELHVRNGETKINVLRSYRTNGPETLALIEENPPNVNSMILDSGVWALNQGTIKHTSNVRTYSKFLSRQKNLFDFYFNFDEKFEGDPLEVNWENQVFLEKKGLLPVPVIHSFEKEEIDHFLSLRDRYEKIAIGSTLGKDPKQLKDVVELLYDNNFKVHVFGYGSYKRLKDLKAWSTDCSSFAQWTKVGRVIFYSQILEEEVTFSFFPEDKNGKRNEDYINIYKYDKENHVLHEYEDYIFVNLGLTLNDITVETESRTLANSFYFSTLEKKVTEEQVVNGINFDSW